jgi:hypothetical protein
MRILWLAGYVVLAATSDLAAATSAYVPDKSHLHRLVQDDTHGNQAPENPARELNAVKRGSELNTLDDLYAAIFRCFVLPPLDQARPGMRITMQFSYTRDGELFGKPRILYETPGATPEQLSAYRYAAAAALARCTPLNFSKSLGSAVAGRVLSIQFVDPRNLRGAELNPWPIPKIR